MSWNSSSFFHCPNLHWSLHSEAMGISVPGTGTLGCVVWPGALIVFSQGIPPDIYPPRAYGTVHYTTTAAFQCHSASPCLWVSGSPPPPTHLDECGFFKSLVVGLQYSLSFWDFLALLFLLLSCNSFCGAQGGKHVYLLLHLDWKCPKNVLSSGKKSQ